jgi:hypothetical protein
MTLCHCGQELHYLSDQVRASIEEAIALYGPDQLISDRGETYRVSRHFLALHPIQPGSLARSGFPRVERQEFA